jgi:hypothetical protein
MTSVFQLRFHCSLRRRRARGGGRPDPLPRRPRLRVNCAHRESLLGGPVPAGPPAAETGNELEGAQEAVQAGGNDVHHHGRGGREEPCVLRRDGRAAGPAIRRVASMPSTPGMRMSNRLTSGRRRRASWRGQVFGMLSTQAPRWFRPGRASQPGIQEYGDLQRLKAHARRRPSERTGD